MPRECSRQPSSTVASWLFAAPATIATSSAAIVSALSTAPSAHGDSTSAETRRISSTDTVFAPSSAAFTSSTGARSCAAPAAPVYVVPSTFADQVRMSCWFASMSYRSTEVASTSPEASVICPRAATSCAVVSLLWSASAAIA